MERFETKMLPRARTGRTSALIAVAALVLGCHGHVDAVVNVPAPSAPPPVVIGEMEPNDSPSYPMAIGPIRAGETLVIAGGVSAWQDPFDGFAFAADGNLFVEFELYPVWGQGDLDLSVWDPFAGQYIGIYGDPTSYESGALTLGHGGEFHLVVSAYDGAQQYELVVRAYATAAAAAGGAQDAPGLRASGARTLELLEADDPARAAFHREHGRTEDDRLNGVLWSIGALLGVGQQ